MMQLSELKQFYNYMKVNHNYNCVNTLNNGIFSKNEFIKNFSELKNFYDRNNKTNCYINYQPLKLPENRKTENVKGVYLLAFDIECSNKQSPETKENIKEMLGYIYKFINISRVNNYMIVFSGNGFHL